MAKKETPGSRLGTKRDVRALKAYSKSKTPAAEVAKALKRTEGAVRQKAKTIGIGLTTGRIRRKSTIPLRPSFLDTCSRRSSLARSRIQLGHENRAE
jgi:hypothetical protein